MDYLTIDETKCKKDAICASVCPAAIIRLPKDGYPQFVPGGNELCIACGHCVAVCPNAALSHKYIPLEDCVPIDKELRSNEVQAAQFLRSRRSIRVYKEKPVEKDKIQHLIETARYAPTASNSQMVEWLVYTDRDKIREIGAWVVDWMREVIKKDPQPSSASYLPLIVAAWDAGYDAVLRNAPALVVASAPREANNGLVDLTLALSYFELAATALDLGTCWAGLLQGALLASPQVKADLGIPKGHPHHYALMLGYPKFKYHRLPERRKPKITWS